MYYTRWYFNEIFRTIGQIIYYSSFLFLIPLILSIIFKEGSFVTLSYLGGFIISFLIGLIWFKFIKKNEIVQLNLIHYLIIVCGVWIVFVTLAALPLMFLGYSFIDSFFEIMSLITTTGITTLPDVPILKSLNFWRAFIAWVGGIGIIFIAYFGLMNSEILNTKKIVKAEGHDLIHQNPKKTTREFGLLYIGLTIIGIISLVIAGVDFFSATTFTMSAISTTGHRQPGDFSDLQSVAVQIIISLIMIIGATSFFTHYFAIKNKSIKEYFRDSQLWSMLLFLFVSFIIFYFYLKSQYGAGSLFLLVSSATTCGGFTDILSEKIIVLAPLLLFILIILMFIGGSSNSTTGGIKRSRFLLFVKSIIWQIRELRLPDLANTPKRHEGEIVDNDDIKFLYFFIITYIVLIVMTVLVLAAYGYPLQHSVFEVVSAQGNVGITTGITSHTMPLVAKIFLILNMWIGRLEIIPVFGLIGMLLQKTKVV